MFILLIVLINNTKTSNYFERKNLDLFFWINFFLLFSHWLWTHIHPITIRHFTCNICCLRTVVIVVWFIVVKVFTLAVYYYIIYWRSLTMNGEKVIYKWVFESHQIIIEQYKEDCTIPCILWFLNKTLYINFAKI